MLCYQSLSRLSSGNRIVNPSDDAGGMAVAYKLQSKLKRTEAVRQNIQNGISFLQVQDGALSTMGKILDRMSELRTLAQDITKNTMDVENYSKEFLELQIQLSQTYREKFNGISLFAVSAAPQVDNPLRPTMNKGRITNEEGVQVTIFSRTIHTSPSGQTADGSVSVGVINLQNLFRLDGGLDNRYASTFRTKEANSNLSASANLEIESTLVMLTMLTKRITRTIQVSSLQVDFFPAYSLYPLGNSPRRSSDLQMPVRKMEPSKHALEWPMNY